MEASSQPAEELGLRSVPDRIRTRVGSHSDVKPDDGADASQLADAGVGHEAALDPHHLRGRPPNATADEPKREARADPRRAQFLTESKEVAIDDPPGSIGWTLSAGHVPSLRPLA